jgi:hypothetical protein
MTGVCERSGVTWSTMTLDGAGRMCGASRVIRRRRLHNRPRRITRLRADPTCETEAVPPASSLHRRPPAVRRCPSFRHPSERWGPATTVAVATARLDSGFRRNDEGVRRCAGRISGASRVIRRHRLHNRTASDYALRADPTCATEAVPPASSLHRRPPAVRRCPSFRHPSERRGPATIVATAAAGLDSGVRRNDGGAAR